MVLFLNTALLGLSVAVIAWGWRRLPPALTAYQLVLVLFTLSSGLTFDPLQSFDRYMLVLFPIYLALGACCRSPRARILYFAVSLLFSLGLSGLFFMGSGSVEQFNSTPLLPCYSTLDKGRPME